MPITWTNNPDADRLLETDGLALLIGLVLDQQVPMEKAFSGPFELKKRLGGKLNAKQIAGMDPEQLDQVFRTRPALTPRASHSPAQSQWPPGCPRERNRRC